MKFFRFWGPAILWMAIIFLASTRESVQVSDEFTINFLFFKTLHVIEYAILFALYYRALKNTSHRKNSINAFGAAFLLTILYAVSDEFHQTLVPTREGKLRDVIIDALGATLSWITIAKLLPKAPKKLRSLAKSLQIV